MDLDKLRDSFHDSFPFDKVIPIDVRVRWAVAAVVPLLIFVLLYTQVISPKVVEMGEQRETLANKTNELLMKQSLNRRMDEFKKRLDLLDQQLILVKEQLPEEREIPNLLDQVSNIGAQSNLEFVIFKPMPEVERDFYAEVPVQLKVLGRFHDLVAFFDRVSNLPRILTVEKLNIAISSLQRARGPKTTLIQATCRAVTFRFIEKHVDEPPKTKKKKK